MKDSEDRGREKNELGRILKQNLFLFLLDFEVKRAQRYQNFLSVLIFKLKHTSHSTNGDGFQLCYKLLSRLLAEEMRETDIIASLRGNRLAVLLPYADVNCGGAAKSRVENILKDYDLRNNGYEVVIQQISFPMNGTSTIDVMKKALGEERA